MWQKWKITYEWKLNKKDRPCQEERDKSIWFDKRGINTCQYTSSHIELYDVSREGSTDHSCWCQQPSQQHHWTTSEFVHHDTAHWTWQQRWLQICCFITTNLRFVLAAMSNIDVFCHIGNATKAIIKVFSFLKLRMPSNLNRRAWPTWWKRSMLCHCTHNQSLASALWSKH